MKTAAKILLGILSVLYPLLWYYGREQGWFYPLAGFMLLLWLARLQHPDLPPEGVAYTRRVTQIWCGFFALNGSLAALLVLLEQYRWWALYTGIIAYILMGILMGGEFAYRKWVLKLNPKTSDKRHTD